MRPGDLVRSIASDPVATARRIRRGALSRVTKALERRGVIPPPTVPSPPARPPAEELIVRAERVWGPSPATLPGINLRADRQLEMVERMRPFGPGLPSLSEGENAGSASVLYLLMRAIESKRIIELGPGLGAAQAKEIVERAGLDPLEVTTLSREELLGLDDPKRFRTLRANDILYVDSSHACRTGSDVNAVLFEVLPNLSPGVWIHFSEVAYPFEYPPRWAQEGRRMGEAYLLRAFLQYNETFQIRFWASYLHQHYRDALRALPKPIAGDRSLWIRKVA